MFFNDEQFIDDILESLNTYNYIYTTVSYNNNTFFSGRDAGLDQFNIVPQIAYYSSKGFNLSIAGQYYEMFIPSWDFTNLSIGYTHTIDKMERATFGIGYTRYIYSDGWDTFTNSIDLSLGIKNKKRSLGTRIAATYLFGNDQSFQLVSQTYGNITVSKNKDYIIKFRPQLNFIIAQQTIALEQLENEYVYNDVFDLLNTQINIPLLLITKSWNFELGYNFNIPNPVSTEPDLDNTSFFNLSVGYLFDLRR